MPEQHYELIFIVSNKIADKEVPRVIDKVKKLIMEEGGKIIGENPLGQKKFAYPISQQKHGFYQIYELTLPKEKVEKIRMELKLNKAEILRFLMIKKEIAKAPAFVPLPSVKKTEKPKTPPVKKVSLADLDKKLDELLNKEIVQ